MGQVIAAFKKIAAEKTTARLQHRFLVARARQLVQESGGFLPTLMFALIIIFLALAAQFESFRDPLVILVSVPLSLTGALIFITLGVGNNAMGQGGMSLNIYTQVGLSDADGPD